MRRLILLSALFGCILGMSIFYGSGNPASAEDNGNSNGSNSIVVQPIIGPSVAQKFTERAKSSWPWYIVRGAGFVAAISLVILMLSGIGQVTGYTFRFLQPLTAWASHRALGLVFGISVLVHMLGLLFDHFVPFNLWQILVPWKSNYKTVTIAGAHLGSLYVSLGILAFYLVAIVIITSLLWVEKKPYLWKLVHLLSYIIILFVFVHALFLGTDLSHGFWRFSWIAIGVCLAAMTIYRLWRAETI